MPFRSSVVGDDRPQSRRGIAAATIASALLCLSAGCGTSAAPYPEAQVTTAVGRAGTCEACGKQLELVAENQYRTVGASRFVLCSDACASQMAEKMKSQ
jgi:hypothetical protein